MCSESSNQSGSATLDLVIDFAESLGRALAEPLPGLDAQLRMAPRPRAGWNPTRIPAGLKDAAALVLVYPYDGLAYLPLTVRSGGLRNHTGQVSLPGGGVDSGETIERAALREAAEEVGIDPGLVHVLGRLTPLHIPVSGYLLHPVVGSVAARPEFVPDDREVARLLEVPVERLRDPTAVEREWWSLERDGTAVQVDVPYFQLDGEKVWGATAMVLAEFLAVIEQAADV
jgi:8-oxo-dGTP pyrophosphatase MutT (NUDIX family)